MTPDQLQYFSEILTSGLVAVMFGLGYLAGGGAAG